MPEAEWRCWQQPLAPAELLARLRGTSLEDITEGTRRRLQIVYDLRDADVLTDAAMERLKRLLSEELRRPQIDSVKDGVLTVTARTIYASQVSVSLSCMLATSQRTECSFQLSEVCERLKEDPTVVEVHLHAANNIIIDCDFTGDEWRGKNLSIVAEWLKVRENGAIIRLSGEQLPGSFETLAYSMEDHE